MLIPWSKTFSLVPRSGSSVKVKYQGHNFKKWPFLEQLSFTNTSCLPLLFDYLLKKKKDKIELINFRLGETQLFTSLKNKPFENIMGKEENIGNHHFLLF